MKTEKTIVAGRLVRKAIYTRAAARESARIRQAKRKISTEAQQRMNAKYSWEKLELMLAANFQAGDLFVTLTFDDDHLPGDRKRTAAILKKFRKELAEIRKARGEELRMIWAIESVHGAGRWHIHLVVNETRNDFADTGSRDEDRPGQRGHPGAGGCDGAGRQLQADGMGRISLHQIPRRPDRAAAGKEAATAAEVITFL